jgi:hypothetical protein
MTGEDSRLDELFENYRAACPEVTPGPDFMPKLWQKIEARRSFWFAFQDLARTFMKACAAVCLLLLVLNFVSRPETHFLASSYVDALVADHSAEKTYYTEAIRSTPSSEEASPGVSH